MAEMKVCTHCGLQASSPTAQFCGGCGSKLEGTQQPTKQSSANDDSSRRRITAQSGFKPPQEGELTVAELIFKGSNLYNTGKPAEAIGCFDEALELDPKNVEALVSKGTTLYALGRSEEALQCCYRTLARDPKNAAAQELKRAVLNKRAAKALGRIGDSRAVEPLIRALNDSHEYARVNAAEALGKIGDSRAVEPLIRALGDSNRDARVNAAYALGRIGDSRAVEPLIMALNDSNDGIREDAAEALGKIGNPRAVLYLERALSDKGLYGRVRVRAVYALGEIGDPAVEPLIRALSHIDELVRGKAAEALVRLYHNNKIGEKNKQAILTKRGAIMSTHKDYTPSSDCTDHHDIGVREF